jgi:DeoR/GlpR family transcriptional regulator of sugar metabolism
MKNTRHHKIINLLTTHHMLRIEELCELMNVSPATIRRDLNLLAGQGYITRINGGAMIPLNSPEHNVNPQQSRDDPYLVYKKALAQVAVGLVKEGDTIFIDAGSTNMEIAQLLVNFKNISIITNGIEIAYRLRTLNKSISIFICGGTIEELTPEASIVGPLAEQMISLFRANLLFLGTSAIDIHKGVTDPHLLLANIKNKMIDNASKVVLVADHSKFGKVKMAHVCSIDKIHHLIVDNKVPRNVLSHFANLGIEISVADVSDATEAAEEATEAASPSDN